MAEIETPRGPIVQAEPAPRPVQEPMERPPVTGPVTGATESKSFPWYAVAIAALAAIAVIVIHFAG